MPDYAAMDALTQGEVGKDIFKVIDKAGVMPLAWGDNGYREISNSKLAIKKPEDLKGLKIRAPNRQVAKMMNFLGATPVSMPLPEITEALTIPVIGIGAGNFYIGSSVKVERRFTQHRRDLRNGNHANEFLQRSAKKYGIDSLKFEIIAVVFDVNHLTDVEQFVMDDLHPKYNISRVAFSAVNDPTIAEKRIKILSKPVVRMTDGAIFSSGYEAARQHTEGSPDNLSTAIRRGWKFAGHFWKFAGSDLTLDQAQKNWNSSDESRKKNAAIAATKARSKPVRRLSDGAIFPSGEIGRASCRERVSSPV